VNKCIYNTQIQIISPENRTNLESWY